MRSSPVVGFLTRGTQLATEAVISQTDTEDQAAATEPIEVAVSRAPFT